MLRCSNCNAPMPVADDPQPVVECPFCHARVRLDAGKRAEAPAANSRAALWVSGAVASLAVLGVVAGLLLTPSKTAAVTVVPMPVVVPTVKLPRAPRAAEDTRLKPSELPQALENGRGWQEVDPAGMVGTFQSFDLNANAAWALALARNWSTDAQFESVYFTGLKPDGTLDLSARREFNVDYRFASPQLHAAQKTLQTVSEKKLLVSLRVMVSEGRVKVLAGNTAPLAADVPAPRFDCPFPTLLKLAQTHGLQPRPHYSGMGRAVQHLKLWRWNLSGEGTSARHTYAFDAQCRTL